MSPTSGFLVNQRRFPAAYRSAVAALNKDPDNLDLLIAYVLAACLTSRVTLAMKALVRARALGLDAERSGDCSRDLALACIRAGWWYRAEQHLQTATELHAAGVDPNRIILLQVARGRLHLACGQVASAVREFEHADQQWGRMPNPHMQWWYNLQPFRIAAMVRLCPATHSDQIAQAYAHLQHRCPPDAKNRADEGKLALKPWGAYAYSLLHRVEFVVASAMPLGPHPKLEQ